MAKTTFTRTKWWSELNKRITYNEKSAPFEGAFLYNQLKFTFKIYVEKLFVQLIQVFLWIRIDHQYR